jgi:TonB family protein
VKALRKSMSLCRLLLVNGKEKIMSAELGNTHEPVGWHGNRNFIVPPDIVPLRRVSPIRKKPRTPCRLSPEGTPVGRAGDREWFTDQLFVDPATRDLRSACGTSFTAHASCVIGVLVLLAGPSPTTPVRVTAPFRMPAYVAVLGGGGAGSSLPLTALPSAAPAKKESVTKTKPAPVRRHDQVPETTAPEPEQFEEPVVDAAEIADASGVAIDDRSNDAIGSGGGGTGGGNGTGSGSGSGQGIGSGVSGVGVTPGPYRVGQGIEPPRKIKHVAPVYPAAALTVRAFGTVLIEATVDVDGRVTDAKVIHSIAALDQAALEAVRQWEFAPSRLNGMPVAVIVTVLVQFAIH